MLWSLLLSIVFLGVGVGVIVFILTSDSFRASRARRKTPTVVSPTERSSDATTINAMMREKLTPPPPSNPATLFSGQNSKETDALADTLDQVKENPILPSAPKSYLRLEERDQSLEHLLARRIPGQEKVSREPPPREFSITVTEKNEPPLEHEKEL